MKAASVREIKLALKQLPPAALAELVLNLSKFKKENKEYLTYLLFEALDEEAFIRAVKSEVETSFSEISYRNFYYIKKSVRKILKEIKKNIRFSKKKSTEVELLLFFCQQLKKMEPNFKRSRILVGLFDRQVGMIEKAIAKLHEDLQFDYAQELDELIQT